MDDSFYSAFLEGDHKVLGVVLKPYSIWHYFLLNAIDSPLLKGQGIQCEDLAIACQIFKTSFPEQPDLKFSLRKWFLVWRLKSNAKLMKKSVESFTDYIKANSQIPKFWKDSTIKGRESEITCPTSLSAVSSLMAMGWTEKEAWNTTFARCRWYEGAHHERTNPNLNFYYDGQNDDLVDFSEMSDDEQYQMLVDHEGEERAKRLWEMSKR